MSALAWIPAFAGMTPSVELTGNEALLTVVLVSKNKKEEFYEEAKRYENNSDV